MEASSRPQELVSTELLEVGTRSPVLQINGGLTMNSELFVQELAHVHGLYGKMKESVFPSTEQSASSVQLIRKDLVLEMRRTVVDFYQWQCKKVRNGSRNTCTFPPRALFFVGVTRRRPVCQESEEDEDDGGEGTSLQQEVRNIAQQNTMFCCHGSKAAACLRVLSAPNEPTFWPPSSLRLSDKPRRFVAPSSRSGETCYSWRHVEKTPLHLSDLQVAAPPSRGAECQQ